MVHFPPQNAYDFKRRYAGFPARIGVNADIKQMFITASDIMSRSIFDAFIWSLTLLQVKIYEKSRLQTAGMAICSLKFFFGECSIFCFFVFF